VHAHTVQRATSAASVLRPARDHAWWVAERRPTLLQVWDVASQVIVTERAGRRTRTNITALEKRLRMVAERSSREAAASGGV
jgi:hypothetical protein